MCVCAVGLDVFVCLTLWPPSVLLAVHFSHNRFDGITHTPQPSHWSYDWRSPALSFTYMRSISKMPASVPGAAALCAQYVKATGKTCPSIVHAPTFDSETHFSSVSKARTTPPVLPARAREQS